MLPSEDYEAPQKFTTSDRTFGLASRISSAGSSALVTRTSPSTLTSYIQRQAATPNQNVSAEPPAEV